MNIQITTTGVKALEGKLTVLQNKLDTGNPTGTLRNVMQRSLYRLQIAMAKYPDRTSKFGTEASKMNPSRNQTL